jgi:hypothetical protein
MTDFTVLHKRSEGELIPQGISLTTTKCANYIQVRFANNTRAVRIRIPLDEETVEVTAESYFDNRIESQQLSSEKHVIELRPWTEE